MMDEFPQRSSRRKFYTVFGLVSILILISLIFGNMIKTNETETLSCPEDYCLNWVYGSCIGSGERYKERTCFDYPNKAVDCEQEKRIYYDKSSQQDESCG